jgi:hypothetical protein
LGASQENRVRNRSGNIAEFGFSILSDLEREGRSKLGKGYDGVKEEKALRLSWKRNVLSGASRGRSCLEPEGAVVGSQ